MHDEADVGLVDAHAEGVGGDHHARAARHERFLRLGALARTELAVVKRDRLIGRLQGIEGLLRGLHRGSVDDAAAGLLAHQFDDAALAIRLLRHLLDRELQVGAVGAGIDEAGARNAQVLHDIRRHLLARGGREREHGRAAERADGRTDLEEGGPEVVAPLRDAVRLVDRHQRHAVRR